MQVGLDLVDAFTDGVWLVEVAPLADPSLLARAVATALRVPEQAQHSLLDTLAARLRGRQLLLVLDNCEHLVVACAQLGVWPRSRMALVGDHQRSVHEACQTLEHLGRRDALAGANRLGRLEGQGCLGDMLTTGSVRQPAW